MKALLEFDPSKRPSAAQALEFAYFRALPAAEAPTVTPAASDEQAAKVAAAFKFEEESLGCNELRILIVNDLFRMGMQK